ncbi:hypothetical protein BKA93DRAFT_823294 [Sparassis latifolia]
MNLSADEHEAIVAQVQITKLQKKLTNVNKQLAKQKKVLAVAQAPTEDDFERIPAEEEEPASDAEMGINLISSVEHCIKEWSTGIHAQVAFSEFENKPRYLNHMEDIASGRDHLLVLYATCVRNGTTALGVADDDAPTGHLSAAAIEDAQKELQGHTGETDSEAEDD